MQEVRLRQARRHRETLRAVQGKPEAILERRQESRRRSRWCTSGGIRRRKAEEEIKAHILCPHSQKRVYYSSKKLIVSP